MHFSLQLLDASGADSDDVTRFLTSNEFPFHVNAKPSHEDVAEAMKAGSYSAPDHEVFWLRTRDRETVGLVRLDDVQDPTPLLDLRLAERYRGQGLGIQALAVVTDFVFTTMPAVTRFEGQTREDNIAMRRIFLRSGWLKEAHYRESWPVEGGAPLASVAYAILRRDWLHKQVTPLVWEDVTL